MRLLGKLLDGRTTTDEHERQRDQLKVTDGRLREAERASREATRRLALVEARVDVLRQRAHQ